MEPQRIIENPNIDLETKQKLHHTQLIYFCPACNCIHAFARKSDGGHHEFDNNFQFPTIKPSLVQQKQNGVCHSFVSQGLIQYLPDCAHGLAGYTIPLPELIKAERYADNGALSHYDWVIPNTGLKVAEEMIDGGIVITA